MDHLTYGPIQPHEIAILQQMIQDTEFSSMSFNRQSSPIFIARYNSYSGVAGFITGRKGYGDESHVFTIGGVYLRHHFDDEHHESELQREFLYWAKKTFDVTHYKLHDFDSPKVIHIFTIPAPPPPLSLVPEESISAEIVGADTVPAFDERRLAYA